MTSTWQSIEIAWSKSDVAPTVSCKVTLRSAVLNQTPQRQIQWLGKCFLQFSFHPTLSQTVVKDFNISFSTKCSVKDRESHDFLYQSICQWLTQNTNATGIQEGILLEAENMSPENNNLPKLHRSIPIEYSLHCVLNNFYHSGFWATCTCPEKQSLPWNFPLYWIYFLHSGSSNLRLLCKRRVCPEFTVVYWIHIF